MMGSSEMAAALVDEMDAAQRRCDTRRPTINSAIHSKPLWPGTLIGKRK
jgi:hypothetical protein